jgi:ribosomal protein S18 acetylase RimI-like enzyme
MITLEQINIRNAAPDDVVKLSILFMQVYIHNYAVEGVSDEYANFLVKQFSAERLESVIINNPNSLIVAEYNNNLIGVAEIGFNRKCPFKGIAAAELDKLYVLERFCGMGIGSMLFRKAEEIIAGQDKNLWLYVWEYNERAKRFYTKNGFTALGTQAYPMEQNMYYNIVMHKTLPVYVPCIA